MKKGLLDKGLPIIFLIPALFIVFSLLTYPVVSSVFYSITDKSLLSELYDIVGGKNYVSILNDPAFWNAFKNSVVWTVLSVFLQLLIGMTAALSLNHIQKFRGVFRTALIIPWAFPNIVIAFTWKWLLNDMSGYVNSLLMEFGIIQSPILFLANQSLAMPTLILINVWFGFPFMMVSILAALQSIPKSEYEAAKIDGAGSIQCFRYITLPNIKIIVRLLIVLRTIWAFNNFDLVFLITGGGPGSSTETLPLYAYRTGWTLNSLGKASAIAVILLIFLLVISTIYLKVLKRVEKEGE